MARRRSLIVSALLPLVLSQLESTSQGEGTSQLGGTTQNNAILTVASDPAQLLAFDAKSYMMTTVATYTLDELVRQGIEAVDPRTGQNRTLEPAHVVIHESAPADQIYWTDTGLGAVLGLRLDGAAIRVCSAGHHAPTL